ncbi:MAG: class I SAM-dependent methyltransferase [Spirochaetales bacterium]|nr:class I SAM-dependent methyltransferase [Spirochaetales bacterium]
MLQSRFHFDQNATLYDEVRPGYPQTLYDDLAFHGNITNHSQLLEVGCGSGIATQEMCSHFSCSIDAIDPGSQLLLHAKKRCSSFAQVQFIQGDFEHFAPSKAYDMVFAATAFHWLKASEKFAQSHRCLKKGGILVAFWNSFRVADAALYQELQNIYHSESPFEHHKDGRALQEEKRMLRRQEFSLQEQFCRHRSFEYSRRFSYSPQQYIHLLASFPHHANHPSFFQKITECVLSFSEIPLLVDTQMEMAQAL